MDLLLGVVAAGVLAAGAVGWLRAAAPLLSSASPLERRLDGGLILAWLAVGFFYLLAGTGQFRLWTAVAVVSLSGLGLARLRKGSGVEPLGAGEGRSLRAPDPADRWLWAALPILGVVAVRTVKSMVSPPLTWDAMTMHLPKAAFWIQSASLSVPDFPDAWSYYRWFPAAGEILFAWVMLPFSSDLLLGPFGTLVWLAILLAGARLSRLLGAGQRIAWLAGAALAALPSVVVFMTANYVDNLVLLFVISAVTQAILFTRTGAPRHAILALAAAGLAVGTKTSALAVMAPLVATVWVLAWRKRGKLETPGLVAAGMGAALVVPCIGYFHTWIRTGSPFYPFKTPLLDLPHHQGLADLFAGSGLLPPGTRVALLDVVSRLFWTPPAGQEHMNFGLGGMLLAVTALAGLLAAFRDRRFGLLWLTLSCAVVSTPLVFSESNLALLTLWVGVLGRHLLPAFAAVALWAAAAPERGARATLAASLLAGLVHQFHLGWSVAMVRPALVVALVLVVAGGLCLGIRRLPALNGRPSWRRALALFLLLLFMPLWSGLRDAARFSIYKETTARGGAFDAHPSHTTFAMGASLWPLLDTPAHLVLAVTVGKDQIGHNQFFYPLMGSRLQNRLVYVPLESRSADSALGPDARYARAVPRRWLQNLEASGADLVVGLWPVTPEREWLAAEGEFEITAFTSLGVPWVGQRANGPKHIAIPNGAGSP